MRSLCLVAALSVITVAGVGCKKTPPPDFDADAHSGPDGKRAGARVIHVNQPVVDEVDYQKQDQTDWYAVRLVGKPQVLTTELTWTNAASDLMVDVFDSAGTQISDCAARGPGNLVNKKILTPIDNPGMVYLRVTAPGKADGSPYTLIAHWVEPPPPPVEQPPEPEPSKAPEPTGKKHQAEHAAPKPAEEGDSSTIQGHVMSAYRGDDDKLTLHIDKGSAQGIKVGMKGTVLSGGTGEEALDGGDFVITQSASKAASAWLPRRCARSATTPVSAHQRLGSQ